MAKSSKTKRKKLPKTVADFDCSRSENAEDFTRWRSLLGSARKTLKLFNPSRATQRQDLQ